MNRYPLWKYVIVAFALMIGFIYTLPNFFGESPAVQVSSAKATIKVDLKIWNALKDRSRTQESHITVPSSTPAASRFA